jgi:hypothetical protein
MLPSLLLAAACPSSSRASPLHRPARSERQASASPVGWAAGAGSLWLYALIWWHQSHLEPAWQQAEDELDDEERQLPQLRRVLLKLRRLHQGLSRRLSDKHRKRADANITPLRRWLGERPGLAAAIGNRCILRPWCLLH